MNPVRAGMGNHPGDYPWSSYAVNGNGRPCSFVTPHPLYESLGNTSELRAFNYRKLFATELKAEVIGDIRQATNGNYVLGNRRFQAEIAAALQRRTTPGRPGRPESKQAN